jgi:hypothetical protein
MSSLRLVPGERAGPSALGILVPPGARTILIVRPRSLGWDLLLVQGLASCAFREMNREEASAVARNFLEALQAWQQGGAGQVAAVPSSSSAGYLVWADVGDFSFIACARVAGQPYHPRVFEREDEARQAASRIAEILNPSPAVVQEVYFNTHHFTR